jgi:hypothetical protein
VAHFLSLHSISSHHYRSTLCVHLSFSRGPEHAVAMLHAYLSSDPSRDIGDNSAVLMLYSDIYSSETCHPLMLHYLISRVLKVCANICAFGT